MAKDNIKYVGAVEGAVKVMRYLVRAGRPDGVASIGRETDLNVSTTFNILKTLAKEDLVSFDASRKTYAIGMGVLEFSIPLLGKSQSKLIYPILVQLAQEHQIMITLWTVTAGDRIILSERVAPSNIVRADMEIGARLPSLIGAVGRCIAARLPLSKEDAKEAFETFRWQNSPGFDAYWQDVEAARATGYAFDRGNLFKGIDVAAAVVCDQEGQPKLGLSAISIAGQVEDAELVEVANDLTKASTLIEKSLFGAIARES
ncbi:IclR family transcriptional regulator [Flexibacterium corallicola]|uniref:IclR family transcriptional regulator n=1 Tax=Flexibacterium corallicola TaxID=3037259 RepID=UPI00286F48DA|nr:IclR family transcriptional regulator C-terminal domain-containing protein [Pseudovibrio sp. M1P-2-3]